MLRDRKRLLRLAGLAAVLAVVCVAVYCVPGCGKSRNAGGSAGDQAPADRSGTKGVSPSAGRESPARAEAKARRSEVVGLAVQKNPEYLPQLKKAAADPDWTVRHAAVDGVGRLGRQGDPQFLIDVLRNPNEQAQVRAAAAERLGEMRFWDAGPAIIDAMEDPSNILRARAGVALRRIIVVDMDYRADAPLSQRSQTVQRIRQLWPWFYEHFTKLEKAKG